MIRNPIVDTSPIHMKWSLRISLLRILPLNPYNSNFIQFQMPQLSKIILHSFIYNFIVLFLKKITSYCWIDYKIMQTFLWKNIKFILLHFYNRLTLMLTPT